MDFFPFEIVHRESEISIITNKLPRDVEIRFLKFISAEYKFINLEKLIQTLISHSVTNYKNCRQF